MTAWLGLAVAYVVGSVPFAYLAGRMLKGVDLRAMGSGTHAACRTIQKVEIGRASCRERV